ncbi:hypothetical protein AB205_0202510, partial [Aquarana catesbeiana]
MMDYNDTQLLSEVYTLLEKKNSQVYFLLYAGNCSENAFEEEIFNDISSLSYGELITVNKFNYYQLVNSLKLLLSKPLNSSVHILDIKLNVIDQYTKEFNVTTSLSYLLITRDDKFTFNFTDPNENTIILEENHNIKFSYSNFSNYAFLSSHLVKSPAVGSWILNAQGDGLLTVQILGYNKNTIILEENHNIKFSYSNFSNYAFLSSHLVKSPAAGSWILNAQGDGLLTVQILGYNSLNISGNCSDSDCHPNATCGEFGGDQQCTCKVGFAGDGWYCDDINECQDRYNNNCDFYGGGSCVNTIGSYTCQCNPGFQYSEEFGCVDIDECADSSLNDCNPLAVCTNGYGSYTCTCPSRYYENELNSCIDPCSNHIILNDTWRSISNIHTEQDYWNSNDWIHCDNGLNGWYRFKGEYDLHIPEYCVPFYRCGTHAPMWITSSHPTVSDGIVSRTACANWRWGGSCCTWSNQIAVKLCPEGFYVYKLQGTPTCWLAYCTDFETMGPTDMTSPAPYSTTDGHTLITDSALTASDITTALTVKMTSTNNFTVSDLTTGLSSTTAFTDRQCIVREGTSFTVLVDIYLNFLGFSFYLEKVLNGLALRFPCITRQYISVLLDNGVTTETISTNRDYFLQSINTNYGESQTYAQTFPCNQSLLYGLKRALEISPAQSVIAAFTFGSMMDYNDTQLLSEVYTLLEKKNSQVYFLLYAGNCLVSASEEQIFNDISSFSYGELIPVNKFNYYQVIMECFYM